MSNYDTHYQHWINLQKNKDGHFAHNLLEKPALKASIKNLFIKNNYKPFKKILLLGCGSGDEVELLKDFVDQNTIITGLDNSKTLIDIANYNYSDNINVNFVCGDIENISLLPFYNDIINNSDSSKFDLVVSSLVMHYVDNWSDVLDNLSRIMYKNSGFVFSIQHPIKWGADKTRNKDFNQFILGYKKMKSHKDSFEIETDYEVYGDYLTNRKISDKLFGKIDIEFYHKSISSIFQIVKKSSFSLENFLEPMPIIEAKKIKPDFYEVHSKIPLFAIFELEKFNLKIK